MPDYVHQKILDVYKLRATLVPIRSLGTDLEEIPVTCTSKSFIGTEDGETWNYTDDDPETDIGSTRTGKLPGLTVIEFEMASAMDIMEKMFAHYSNDTLFDIRWVYDDTAYENIDTYLLKGAKLLNPISTGSTENANYSAMTIRLQPLGGGKLVNLVEFTQTPRTEAQP